MSTLGTKLSKLRKDHKLSQMEVAEILGVSQTAYNSWESDKSKPKSENLLKISQYYNINLRELIDDNEKISIANNNISGGSNFIAKDSSTNTINNIHPSPEIIEQLLKSHEQLLKLLEVQQEQQSQTSTLLESHFQLLELMYKKIN